MCLEFDAFCAASVTNDDEPSQFVTIPYETLQTTNNVSTLSLLTTTLSDTRLDDLCAIIYSAR